MGQIFVGQVFLVGCIVTALVAAEHGMVTPMLVAVSVAAGLAWAIAWWFSPLPNASEHGTGRLFGAGYWGFRKDE